MFVKALVYIAIAVNIVVSDSVKDELSTVYQSNGQPFSELPCMLVGGTCAKEDSCPKDSKVITKGLCPMQQEEGIDCCRSKEPNIRCRSRGGECVSIEDFKCPKFLIVTSATDCGKREVCCVFTY